MKLRPDLLDANSPRDLEVIQLTDEEIPGAHIYMEAQIFTLDSKRFILHRGADAHGGDRFSPEHRFLVCDIEDGCSLYPITDELGATSPSVAPAGDWVYYFVDETQVNGGRFLLKRVSLDGCRRETLMVVDTPLPETRFWATRLYPLSTISSDGKRLAISSFLTTGKGEESTWGLMVFDLETATVNLILHGATWCNVHPQYSRSTDDEGSHDILIQENHGNEFDPASGVVNKLVGGAGADIHVIRDDGTNFRTMPWGRDGNEHCQGHQCWRGRTSWAITSTSTIEPRECQLIEGRAIADSGHQGRQTPGADEARNDLTRDYPSPDFYHFATDIEGRFLITDSGPREGGGGLHLGELSTPGEAPLASMTYLLNPRSSWKKDSHIHPFLSPDGTMGFFNSDESGILQAYMVRLRG